MMIAADGVDRARGLYRTRAQPRQARLRGRRRVARARGERRRAAEPALEDSCGAGRGHAAAPRRASAGALEFETIEARPSPRTAGSSTSSHPQEPRARPDRGPHDRGQRRDRAFPREARPLVDPARRARAAAVGPHRRHRRRFGATLPPEPTPGALGVPRRAARPTRSASPTSLASSSCWARASTPAPTAPRLRPLRPRGRRLHALDRAEPPLPRPRHAAPAEGGAEQAAGPTATTSSATSRHCTERENAARKVERTMRKVAAARLLSRTSARVRRDRHRRHARGPFARLVARPPRAAW